MCNKVKRAAVALVALIGGVAAFVPAAGAGPNSVLTVQCSNVDLQLDIPRSVIGIWFGVESDGDARTFVVRSYATVVGGTTVSGTYSQAGGADADVVLCDTQLHGRAFTFELFEVGGA